MAGAGVFSVEELLSLTVGTPSLILRLALAYVNRLRDGIVRFITSHADSLRQSGGRSKGGLRLPLRGVMSFEGRA